MGEITFVVPGHHATTRASTDDAAPPPSPDLPGRVRASVIVATTRDATESVSLEVMSDVEAVVLHLDGGLSLTLHPEHARDLLLAQPSASVDLEETPPSVVNVPTSLSWDALAPESTRSGLLETVQRIAVKGFEVLTELAGDQAPELAAEAIARILDDRVDTGVYQLSRDQLPRLKGSPSKVARIPRAAKPALVFIHGTFLDTASTFGNLWEKHGGKVQELFVEYADRVYAFDHPTLNQSPIENALALASAVDEGTVLHLATHSRGGLVAEVLARACAEPANATADATFEAETDKKALAELRSVVQARGLRVERVVRVACPARGTLLASKRLDALFSIVQWLLKLSGVPIAPELVAFLGAVAKARLKPEKLPGLAALVPDSELVRWLNNGGAALSSELRVIAGDVEGTTVSGWVKRLVSDLFYWTDNDLVVQTRSMYGGAPRQSASFFLHAAGEVSHFNYFSHELTARALVDGLTQTQPPGFEAIGPLSLAGTDSSGTRALVASAPEPNKPAVFILPGILGSNLDKNGRRLWLSHQLLGRLRELDYSASDGISAGPPLEGYYGALARGLSTTHEVIPFGFDWRRPLEDEARRLAKAVRAALEARESTGTPVRLMAHSMGGLLARTLELLHADVWSDMMRHEGARVVLLGVPNRGAYTPMQVLTGDHTFGNWLTLLGSPLREQEARASMGGMPGLLQLQAGLLDGPWPLGQVGTWKELAAADLAATKRRSWWHRAAFDLGCYQWGIPSEAALAAAVQLRKNLDARQLSSPEKVKLVVGQAWLTPSGFVMGPDGLVYRHDVERGDGTVTLSSALLPGVDAWLSHAEHSHLPARSEDFNAYRDLLTTGTTDRLDRVPVSTRGQDLEAPATKTQLSRPAREPSRAGAPSHITSLLARPALDSKAGTSPQARALRVAVEHGSLKFIKPPLMVGHYESDALSGTERVVDELIGGTMSVALKAHAYPRDPGDQRVFANTNANTDNPLALPRPKAVIVVGLGNEGSLRPEKLSQAVQQGIVAWAQRLFEEGSREPFELASTLIGSGGVGVSAGAAARAIAQGALDANDTLAQCAWPALDKLTLIEVYQERAAEAWREVHVQASSARGRLQLYESIDKGTGGVLRPLEQDYRGADYDLVTATTRGGGEEVGDIYYTLDTRRARAEVRAQATQIKLVREMVKRGANYASTDRNNDTGRTLFRLLVPQDLRPFLAGDGRLLLQLDQTTAAIPWELLHANEPDDGTTLPWAIRTKLLRKFETASYRSQLTDASVDDGFLVIGNPKLTDPRYRPLSGAVTEAKKVAQVLEQKYPGRVTSLVSDNDAIEIMNAVFARRYRVLHIAAHGEEGKGKGVVLSDDIFLSAKELGSMEAVPELVFVNCCYLAKSAPTATEPPPGFDAAQFAASVAESLIKLGVRCVVAAGWAVGDEAAAVFATAFYQALLDAKSFQEAVAEARIAAREKRDNTWAAYQCYGDPDWRLFGHSKASWMTPASKLEFPTVFSLRLYLDTLVTRVKCDGMPKEQARQQIEELTSRFEHWSKQGEVAEAFGNAFAATQSFAKAIRWYRLAIAAEDCGASMCSVEQLANLVARVEWEKVRESLSSTPADLTLAHSSIGEALSLLDKLVGMAATSERLSLRGSAYKRLALLERFADNAAAEKLALQHMRDAYAAAEQRAMAEGLPHFYSGQNRLAAELVLSAIDGTPFAPVNLSSVLEHASRRVKEEPDFWSVVSVTDLQSYEAYATGSLAEKLPSLLKDYDDLRRRIPAANQWASVRDAAELAFAHPAVRAHFPDSIDQLLTRLRTFARGG
jgi:hypothetical protein